MDPPTALLLALPMILVACVWCAFRLPRSSPQRKPPPSSIFGNSLVDTLVIMWMGFDFFEAARLLRPSDTCKMVCLWFLGQPLVIVYDRELKRKVLLQRKPELRPELGPQYEKLHGIDLQLMSGSKYELLRRKLRCIISPRAMDSYCPVIAQTYGAMLQRLSQAGGIVVLEQELQFTQLYLACKLFAGVEFNVNSKQFNKFFEAYKATALPLWGASRAQTQKGYECSLYIKSELKRQVDLKLDDMLRRGCLRDPDYKPANGLEALVHALAEGESLSEEAMNDVVNSIFLLIEAGHITTVQVLCSSIALLKLPENETCLDAAREEVRSAFEMTVQELLKLEYVQGCFNEAMRLVPLVAGLPRKTVSTNAFEIGEYTIPPAALVLMPTYEALSDPEVFDEPHRFDPARWARIRRDVRSSDAGVRARAQRAEEDFVPFAVGMHDCLGKPIAVLSMTIFLATFLKEYDMDTEPWSVKKRVFPYKTINNGLRGVVTRL